MPEAFSQPPALSAKAFAFLRSDGSVMTWGHDTCGGSSRRVQRQLVDVEAAVHLLKIFFCLSTKSIHDQWDTRANTPVQTMI